LEKHRYQSKNREKTSQLHLIAQFCMQNMNYELCVEVVGGERKLIPWTTTYLLLSSIALIFFLFFLTSQANSRPSRLVTPTPSTPSTHYTPIQPSPSPLSPSSNLPRISPSNAKETSPAAKITASSRKDKNSSGGGDAPKVMGRTSGPSFGKSQKTGPLLMNLGKASLTAVAIALCWWLFDSEANLRSIKAAGHHHHAM